jgi:two-component system, LytTR family, sensor kinase
MNTKWVPRKWIEISLHILFWVFIFALPYLLTPAIQEHDKNNEFEFNARSFYIINFTNNIFRLFLFYANAFLFIPALMYKRKYLLYALIIVGSFFISYIIDKAIFHYLIPASRHSLGNFFVFSIFPFLFIIMTSAAYRTTVDKIRSDKQSKEKETENLKTELSFLRSQVSPHFMFNVLNNMVALARKKSDDLEPSLIKLSSLLRYMLYETDEDKVLLEREIDYLNSYIDLQRQRFGKNVAIHTNINITSNGYSIEPMLLIPFVENAFKHGTGMIENAQIIIDLGVKNGMLDFSVRNKYLDTIDEPKDKTSGIGLNNVRRRLNLLYQQNHSLDVVKKDGWFNIKLHLNLH